jgi:SCY1-like protein 1
MVPDAKLYASPEVKKSGWSSLKRSALVDYGCEIGYSQVSNSLDPAATDSYSFGILIHSVFNPNSPPPPTTEPPHAAPLPSSRGSIPTNVFPSFKRLLNPNPKPRLTVKGFLDIGMAEKAGDGAGFFINNNLIKICSGLEGFGLASDAEKTAFLR